MSESRLPSIADFADAEHCVLEDVTAMHRPRDAAADPSRPQARKVRDEILIRDRLRGRRTRVRLYTEGWLDLEVAGRGSRARHLRMDLRFLDSVPTIERSFPHRLYQAGGVTAGLTLVAALPAMLGWLPGLMSPAAIILGIATLALLGTAVIGSHEEISFKTLHGRAKTVRLVAGLGTIGRFRRLMPKMAEAIAASAERVDEEASVYLRAEMHEHYRLRTEGVLTDEECADSTGRILDHFDGPI